MRTTSAALLAALLLPFPVSAGQIVWRAPTTGTLTFVPPPELEVDPAPGVVDFGISYGSVRVRSGTGLFISPIWPSKGSKTGYSFSSPDLPQSLTLDLSSGSIRGRMSVAGTYDFSVTITDGTGQSQTVLITVVVE
ncbi:Hypothetical protein NGAL_HAMBI2610_48850 [Neorhizobium galegae bv. orientalis]|nr:Hypothetical protein NGAL_HAMBI2610_48850 [Neorhizobium galegae bv. orientalis]